MDPVPLLRELAISVALGLLVGLQRERTKADVAGFRTFPLITLLGTLCAFLSAEFYNPWILVAGFAGVIGLILIGNLPKLGQPDADRGVTTEVAMLVMFAVGALVVAGSWAAAAAVTATVVILLQLKPELHGFAARVGDQDIRAILQFVLITFIILPVLPNKPYDPLEWVKPLFPGVSLDDFEVLNPHEIWLMVVLVVAISLGGYVTYKLFGSRAGTLLGGILGGIISSTATTVSYSRKTAKSSEASSMAAFVILIATTVTFIRVLLEIAVAGPALLPIAAGPILIMFAVTAVLCGFLWFSRRHDKNGMPSQGNPTELKSAILFALAYAVVLVAVAAGKAILGSESEWLYAIAVLSGMTDMDAITLSTSRLVGSGHLKAAIGWRLIVIATMSNLFFKGLIVAAIGDRRLLKQIAVLFGLSLLSGVGVLIFWR